MADPLYVMAAYGAGLGTAFVVMAYMGGYLFNSNAMKAYAKTELGELILSMVLVTIIVGFISHPELFTKAMMPNDPYFGQTIPYQDGVSGPIDYTTGELMGRSDGIPAGTQHLIYQRMEKPLIDLQAAMAKSSVYLSKLISYNYNYQVGIPYANPTGSASPAAGGGMLQSALMLGIDTTSINLMLAGGIKVLYVFLLFAATTLLLPLGVLLRFIPPVRQAASLMIAIGLAVTIVFPISVMWGTYLLWNPGFGNQVHAMDDPGDPPSKGFICSPVMAFVASTGEDILSATLRIIFCTGPQAVLPMCTPAVPNPNDIPIPINPVGLEDWTKFGVWAAKFLTTATNSVTLWLGSPTADDVINKAFNPIVDNILPTAVARNLAVLFMAVIELVCSILMVKSIAQVLGAENQLYGLSRMV